MGVLRQDALRISLEAQEDRRRRAVAAVQAGHSQAAVSTTLGVSPKTVWRWVNAVRRNGSQALKAGRRGRRPGEQKALDPKQEARLWRAVLGKFPDQVAIPGLVWTRPQVRQLIRNWFGIGLSLITVGKYLRSWGLSPQKPIRWAYEQRLVRQVNRKIHLIVDRHPVHRRVSVRDWPAENVASIEMHLMPGYAPELNPVELLNGDIKRHVAQANPGTVTAAATAHLRRRQNQPKIVKALFRKPEVRYAAA
jgi:transposase